MFHIGFCSGKDETRASFFLFWLVVHSVFVQSAAILLSLFRSRVLRIPRIRVTSDCVALDDDPQDRSRPSTCLALLLTSFAEPRNSLVKISAQSPFTLRRHHLELTLEKASLHPSRVWVTRFPPSSVQPTLSSMMTFASCAYQRHPAQPRPSSAKSRLLVVHK